MFLLDPSVCGTVCISRPKRNQGGSFLCDPWQGCEFSWGIKANSNSGRVVIWLRGTVIDVSPSFMRYSSHGGVRWFLSGLEGSGLWNWNIHIQPPWWRDFSIQLANIIVIVQYLRPVSSTFKSMFFLISITPHLLFCLIGHHFDFADNTKWLDNLCFSLRPRVFR